MTHPADQSRPTQDCCVSHLSSSTRNLTISITCMILLCFGLVNRSSFQGEFSLLACHFDIVTRTFLENLSRLWDGKHESARRLRSHQDLSSIEKKNDKQIPNVIHPMTKKGAQWNFQVHSLMFCDMSHYRSSRGEIAASANCARMRQGRIHVNQTQVGRIHCACESE